MTNLKLPTLGLSLVLLLAACSKNDMQEESANASPATTAVVADTVGWKSANAWETADQESFSVRYFTITDASITTDVADNGLVLLFKRNGTTVNALPFEEAASNNSASTNANYWYHQVSEGSLLVSCDVYDGAATNAADAFKYFVITPEKLQSLEADGFTTESLLNLSYADAAFLLNKAS